MTVHHSNPSDILAPSILSLRDGASLLQNVKAEIAKQILGQDDLITEALCVFLSEGHLLITGAPGLAKTTLVRTIGDQLSLKFGRVQFTPDLLPSDILGSDVLHIDTMTQKRSFEFSPGPVFANLLLADEINRASPRTQSAMLEAMQEKQVTVGGVSYPVPTPFMVFATQNPFESEGTFPLPEAQLDRFLLHSLIDYPSAESELRVLEHHAKTSRAPISKKPLSIQEVRALQALAKTISVRQEILTLINELVRSSRPQDPLCPAEIKDLLWYGAGPRASLSLISSCQALALSEGEDSVRWRHVRRFACQALRHRIKIIYKKGSLSQDEVIQNLISHLEKHHKKWVEAT